LKVTEFENNCIRPFRDSDVDAIAELIHRTIDACYTGIYPPRAVDFFKKFHSPNKILERSKEGFILVTERNGKAIGTGAVVDNEIYGVFIEPALQGAGLGGAIMQELETRAKAMGHDVVSLSISLPSRQFYESRGYEVYEEAHLDVGEGQQLDFWNAKKRL
jgi:putative acetyltransferase